MVLFDYEDYRGVNDVGSVNQVFILVSFKYCRASIFYFFKLTKRTFLVFLAACPVIYFITKIMAYYFTIL